MLAESVIERAIFPYQDIVSYTLAVIQKHVYYRKKSIAWINFENDRVTDKLAIEKQLATLREEFASRLKQRIDGMVTSLEMIEQFDEPSEAFRNIHREIHTLAGSAGSLGHESEDDRLSCMR